jgi:hypothetical protein
MPVTITKVKGGYQVRTPHMIHAKHTSLANAKKQAAIINAADAGHPFTTKKRRKSKRKSKK